MKYRSLGDGGPKVSAIGLGCMGMGGTYGAVDQTEAIKAVHAAIDAGVTLIDTAECYGPIKVNQDGSSDLFGYENELLVGEALEGHRDKVVLCTKIGFEHDGNGRRIGQNASAAHLKGAVDGCLSRLRTDVIDVLYLHRADPNVEIEETVGAMSELVREGKVRFLGLSEANQEQIDRAGAVHTIVVQQSEYSLWEREVENGEIEFCRARGIALVPFAPLGRGFLAGNAKPAESYPANDYRRLEPRLQKGNYEANMAIANAVKEMASERGLSPAQLAIAWLVNQDVIPIPGAERVDWALENAAAADVELTKDDLKRLDEIAPKGKTAGPRWGGKWAEQIDK
ncbi:aldo/keto reductase [Hoeflea sp.]|uniref:aldo/keto reductase n=1 Tax=Hoeflea sp. TaxID=1940281 RepID=UPI003B017238